MGEYGKVINAAVKREIKLQLCLVYTDIKNLEEQNRNLKQKYFDSLKRIKAIEEFLREKKSDGSDFGM